MTMLFVYGSLRKGQYNSYLMKESRFIRTAILTGYKMVSMGDYPAIYPTHNSKDIIHGDIYDVDEKAFGYIDRMEKSAGYICKTISALKVRVYEIAKERAKRHEEISSGDWVLYQKSKRIAKMQR